MKATIEALNRYLAAVAAQLAAEAAKEGLTDDNSAPSETADAA